VCVAAGRIELEVVERDQPFAAQPVYDLLRIEGLIVERPQVSHLYKIPNIFTHLNIMQHLLMRVAVGIHKVQQPPKFFDLSSFRACFIIRATWSV
jgi:hypothetical protein